MNGLPCSPFFSPQNEGYNFEGRKVNIRTILRKI